MSDFFCGLKNGQTTHKAFWKKFLFFFCIVLCVCVYVFLISLKTRKLSYFSVIKNMKHAF